MGPTKTRVEIIATGLQLYQSAITYLASDHTTVDGRKTALELKKKFEEQAPLYVAELLESYELD